MRYKSQVWRNTRLERSWVRFPMRYYYKDALSKRSHDWAICYRKGFSKTLLNFREPYLIWERFENREEMHFWRIEFKGFKYLVAVSESIANVLYRGLNSKTFKWVLHDWYRSTFFVDTQRIPISLVRMKSDTSDRGIPRILWPFASNSYSADGYTP